MFYALPSSSTGHAHRIFSLTYLAFDWYRVARPQETTSVWPTREILVTSEIETLDYTDGDDTERFRIMLDLFHEKT